MHNVNNYEYIIYPMYDMDKSNLREIESRLRDDMESTIMRHHDEDGCMEGSHTRVEASKMENKRFD